YKTSRRNGGINWIKLDVFQEDQWQSLVTVKDNFQRHRRHHFDPVTADTLRLTVNATHGAKTARVFEIRVYDKEAQ
ncbi:MAG: hypothetical protein R6U98_15325, partial [Pirellulaceae bacterium]